MQSMKKFLLFSLFALLSAVAQAAPKPQWVRKGETSLNTQRTNHTYYFKIVQGVDGSLERLRRQRLVTLAEYIGQRNNLSGRAEATIDNQQFGADDVQTNGVFRITFSNDFNAPVFLAQLVDEYWEKTSAGYHYYALFAVADEPGEGVTFDRFDVTRTYGAAPVIMSVIPGVGQLYKGQTLKGACMLGGAAVGAGAIIYCENERASYAAKIKEQPKHAQSYKTKADNYETARNVAIGVTGALVVWSVIDAAVTPGVTRIKVRRGEQLYIQPTAFVQPAGMAFGASFRFTF